MTKSEVEKIAEKVKAALKEAGDPSDKSRVDKFVKALDDSVAVHKEHVKDA